MVDNAEQKLQKIEEDKIINISGVDVKDKNSEVWDNYLKKPYTYDYNNYCFNYDDSSIPSVDDIAKKVRINFDYEINFDILFKISIGKIKI